MIRIKEALVSDAGSLMHAQSRAWLDSYPNSSAGVSKEDVEEKVKEWERLGDQRITEKLNDPKTKTWVAKDGERTVGFIGILREEKEDHIEAIFVLPEYQGQGVGKLLMKTALEYLKDSERIVVDVLYYNLRAINFYKSFGFKKDEETFIESLVLPSGKRIEKILMVKS